MSDSMTTEEMRVALDGRKALVDEFLKELGETEPLVNRSECEREIEKLLENECRLDRDIKKYYRILEKQAAAAEEFISKMKDDSGQIERDRLLAHLDSLTQPIFGHALLVVAAKEKDLDFIHNLSAEHREALGILDRRAVEDRLSYEIAENNEVLTKQNQELIKSNRLTNDLFDQITKKIDETLGLTNKLEKAEYRLSELNRRVPS
ncbi:hypothetical protein GL218_01143 [Daldinia childiae]|uniref:uncharacterized protein n=1 Tax=Daldinia childiae TaxID=326645 RepID=UPI001445F104|nr:uncharacterized protein GL218_01143 [Daldinia childiae]KAF3064215.1 hypothetical protein GL218_01143 [Daldinia childiae]